MLLPILIQAPPLPSRSRPRADADVAQLPPLSAGSGAVCEGPGWRQPWLERMREEEGGRAPPAAPHLRHRRTRPSPSSSREVVLGLALGRWWRSSDGLRAALALRRSRSHMGPPPSCGGSLRWRAYDGSWEAGPWWPVVLGHGL
jgi:hypothetical protein